MARERKKEKAGQGGSGRANPSCHVALPAAVGPESAQGFRKPWLEPNPCMEAGQPAAGCPALNCIAWKGQDMGA